MESSLKNKRAYARKHGYFAEMTNLDDVASDKDKDAESEEDNEDGGDKDKGLEEDGDSSDTSDA